MTIVVIPMARTASLQDRNLSRPPQASSTIPTR